MKAALATLLAVLLCAERASSLICFHCENAESTWGCMSMKTCEGTGDQCFTKYFGSGVGDKHKQYISKGCTPSCTTGGVDLGLMAYSMKCCQKDFCNTSGAMGVKSSSLLLALGTLASLLYILGAKL